MTTLKPWETVRSEVLFEQAPWLRVFSDTVKLPDGRVVDGYLRLQQPDFVMIVPVRQDNVLGLIRCYKHGVGEIDLQPPAGYLDPGEIPPTAAKRELLEETGCEATDLYHLGTYVMSGNRGTGQAHIYLATDCQQVADPESGDLEEQELVWLPVDEVRQTWIEGTFRQISTSAAIGLALAWIDGHGKL
jgi:8-oxo-dGTP pyrophosphatase MutT (NUDIX family)